MRLGECVPGHYEVEEIEDLARSYRWCSSRAKAAARRRSSGLDRFGACLRMRDGRHSEHPGRVRRPATR